MVKYPWWLISSPPSPWRRWTELASDGHLSSQSGGRPARAGSATPPTQLVTLWKCRSKFLKTGVKLTIVLSKTCICEAPLFKFKIFRSVVFRSHKTLGVFLGFWPQIRQPKKIVQLLLNGSKCYSSSWAWGEVWDSPQGWRGRPSVTKGSAGSRLSSPHWVP